MAAGLLVLAVSVLMVGLGGIRLGRALARFRGEARASAGREARWSERVVREHLSAQGARRESRAGD